MAIRLSELVCLQWFAPVAPVANIADFPSRGKHHPVLTEEFMCKQATTLDIFKRCVDEFLVDQ